MTGAAIGLGLGDPGADLRADPHRRCHVHRQLTSAAIDGKKRRSLLALMQSLVGLVRKAHFAKFAVYALGVLAVVFALGVVEVGTVRGGSPASHGGLDIELRRGSWFY